MAIKIFSLKQVPEDEAEEIRALLTDNHIDHYETPAGNWAISAAAIWLKDEGQAPQARLLIDQYQQERVIRVREEYARLKQAGSQRTFIDVVRDNPRQFFVYLIAILAVLYLSTMPFIGMGQ